MARLVVIVRHGEKERAPGGPGLTALGRSQAAATAAWVTQAAAPVTAVWSSPLRRATETAGAIAGPAGLPVNVDGLRMLLGDDELRRRSPGLIEDGVPGCGAF